jgi:hypothetical protein
MEGGNLLSIYENRINEYERLIMTDIENKQQHENEMAEYILKSLPFIKKHSNHKSSDEKNTLETVFNTTKKVGLQKKQILRDYLLQVENKVIPSEKKEKKKGLGNMMISDIITHCEKCNSRNVHIDDLNSDVICRDCGFCKFVQLDGGLTYREEQECEKVFNYFYKRENHFNEWLNQFQARETTNIPDDVINQLKADFKKNKIKDLKEITQAKVKACLKKLGHSKYYEHVPYITNLLNGIKPPSMSQELEDRLRLMFQQNPRTF